MILCFSIRCSKARRAALDSLSIFSISSSLTVVATPGVPSEGSLLLSLSVKGSSDDDRGSLDSLSGVASCSPPSFSFVGSRS